jgi:hypothetical protein
MVLLTELSLPGLEAAVPPALSHRRPYALVGKNVGAAAVYPRQPLRQRVGGAVALDLARRGRGKVRASRGSSRLLQGDEPV